MTIENTNVSRRTLVKGAAWSLPVVAVAAATPLAAASTGNATAAWTATNTQLLSLALLNGTGTVSAALLPSAPTAFRITNGAGVIPNVTAIFSVSQDTSALDVNIPVGTRRMAGLGPATVPGGTKVGATGVADREVSGIDILGTLYAQDTTTTFNLGDIADGQAVDFNNITWGAVPRSGLGVSINVGATFNVVVNLQSNGTTFATLSGSNVTVPVNAGLL